MKLAVFRSRKRAASCHLRPGRLRIESAATSKRERKKVITYTWTSKTAAELLFSIRINHKQYERTKHEH